MSFACNLNANATNHSKTNQESSGRCDSQDSKESGNILTKIKKKKNSAEEIFFDISTSITIVKN